MMNQPAALWSAKLLDWHETLAGNGNAWTDSPDLDSALVPEDETDRDIAIGIFAKSKFNVSSELRATRARLAEITQYAEELTLR